MLLCFPCGPSCSTSSPGGNLVDGLPPAATLTSASVPTAHLKVCLRYIQVLIESFHVQIEAFQVSIEIFHVLIELFSGFN